MNAELKNQLKKLADRYETSSFYDADPSQFLNWSENQREAELISFFSALLAFGNRKLFIPKIRFVLETAGKKGGFYSWIKKREYESDFKSPDENNSSKFYRFYSYDDILTLFRELSSVLENYGSLENAVRSTQVQLKKEAEFDKLKSVRRLYGKTYDFRRFADSVFCSDAISSLFQLSKIVPKGKNSANKRIFMFLRWMIRTGSPVDKGFWTWLSPSSLVIPLDTHVLQESEKLMLIPEKSSCSIKTALILSDKLSEVWPEDPCKGDFALFGLGVSDEKNQSN